MVTENNNNKFYHMFAPKGNTFKVEYGRVGCKVSTCEYWVSDWDKKYYEKIKKGYTDCTELLKQPTDNKNYKSIQDAGVADLIKRLREFAQHVIDNNYTIAVGTVTEKMITEAVEQLNKVANTSDVDRFNAELIRLFKIIPRKMSKVQDFLAVTKRDFEAIVQREQDLLDIMKGQIKTNAGANDKLTVLEANGLELQDVTADEIKNIKNHLGDVAPKFKRAWKVKNTKTQEQFDKFVADNNITDCKFLWHGSRNENWWSILNSGLLLNPNAVITGKMFGNGIYFANKARKSFGYTSARGSYWVGGNSDTAFMAVYKVAYGKPYDVYTHNSSYYDINENKLHKLDKNANCLHAHAGRDLKNDEIIVYNEAQTTIKYIVEFAA